MCCKVFALFVYLQCRVLWRYSQECLNNHSTACSDCNITIFLGKILISVNEPSTEASLKFRFTVISLRDSRKLEKVHFVLRCRLRPESCEDFQHPSQKAETQATHTTLHVLGSICHPSHYNTVEQSYFIVQGKRKHDQC